MSALNICPDSRRGQRSFIIIMWATAVCIKCMHAYTDAGPQQVSVSFLVRTSGTGRRQQLRGKTVVVFLGYCPPQPMSTTTACRCPGSKRVILKSCSHQRALRGWRMKFYFFKLVFNVCQDTRHQSRIAARLLHKSTRAYWHLVVGFQTALFWPLHSKRTEKERKREKRKEGGKRGEGGGEREAGGHKG